MPYHTGVGNGGNIEITADSLSVTGGAQISASTSGEGNAGDLQITATDSIEVSGISADNQFVSQLTVEAGSNSIGSGGDLTVNARDLNVSGGRISAAAASGEGGNITLRIDDTITLSNQSLISAAATGDGDGGNIEIVTDFIIARPNQNSDIVANADRIGGKITIDAQGIFGIEVRPQNDRTNDINASGGVEEGQVIINNPDVDITKGSLETPQNVVEPEQTVTQACQSVSITGKASGLTIKGKGGIPPLPTEPMDSDAILVNGQLTNPNPQIQSQDIKPIKTSIGDIYPARGIIKTEDGQVILTAYPTDNIDTRTPQISPNCS